MKKYFLIWLAASTMSVMFAAKPDNTLLVSLIPDSLKTNAYAVLRSNIVEFDMASETSATQNVTYTITVLDKKGNDMAGFRYPADKFRRLKSFSAKLFDANGNQIDNFKLSDVKATEWSDAYTLAQDVTYHYFDCASPVLPYTIKYEYSVEYKNGILVFPGFYPQDTYNLSVENAEYRLLIPAGCEYQNKTHNLPVAPQKSNNPKDKSLLWKVNGLKAVEYEAFAGQLDDIAPLMFIRPVSFSYDGIKGRISDWNELGAWIYDLVKGRDVLPEDAKAKIRDLVKDAKTDREKVKILYDHLGNTTRYVSIQLGIGGYQPMKAAEVYKTGFGDCKALTNYMKAMLSVVGIPSVYTAIRLDAANKTIYPDFANFNQMNHVVLQVPLPGDTLWLECTNPRTPFGFVHNGISGHDALLITENGGRIARTTDYADTLNLESFNARVALTAEGRARVETEKSCRFRIFDLYDDFSTTKPSEQNDLLRAGIKLAHATVSGINFKEEKTSAPSLDINFVWDTNNYGTRTGTRLFVPVNPFRNGYSNLKKNKRTRDIKIHNGYYDADTIELQIPEGYEIESVPANVQLVTDFGTYELKLDVKEAKILINNQLFIKAGDWNVSLYPSFVEFLTKVTDTYGSKIVLRKKV